eukprot:scaffold1200_cov383-Prasinococcus_capsulatus_cf.AAC.13
MDKDIILEESTISDCVPPRRSQAAVSPRAKAHTHSIRGSHHSPAGSPSSALSSAFSRSPRPDNLDPRQPVPAGALRTIGPASAQERGARRVERDAAAVAASGGGPSVAALAVAQEYLGPVGVPSQPQLGRAPGSRLRHGVTRSAATPTIRLQEHQSMGGASGKWALR